MQRYFLNQIYTEISPQDIQIDHEHIHHMLKVMRMREGERCFLVFTDKVAIEAEVIAIKEDEISLKEVAKEHKNKELPVHVTLACGFPKGDKLEWIVQKGTELGAQNFIGFPAKTSVVKWDHKKLQKKEQRLQKIAREAAEQSHRQALPKVKLLEKHTELVQLLNQYDKILVAYEESAKQAENSCFAQAITNLKPGDNLLVIFGPEGGLAPKEIEIYENNQAICVGLGPRIMRTETAPLYVLSACSYQWELLK